MQTNQSSTALASRRTGRNPRMAKLGLTLVGLITPELTFSMDGREDLNQAGPS